MIGRHCPIFAVNREVILLLLLLLFGMVAGFELNFGFASFFFPFFFSSLCPSNPQTNKPPNIFSLLLIWNCQKFVEIGVFDYFFPSPPIFVLFVDCRCWYRYRNQLVILGPIPTKCMYVLCGEDAPLHLLFSLPSSLLYPNVTLSSPSPLYAFFLLSKSI